MFLGNFTLSMCEESWFGLSEQEPRLDITTSVPLLLLAGFLVGFGTRMGSGCTSGHGVCGISRLSSRSLVATVVFMVVAALVVTISRHMFAGPP